MSYRIPEETIENIRRSIDIVDVVGEYVQLKKQGRNYFGLCPFHGENTPSFSVSTDKQFYHCFGCGAGGNVFSFLMELEGLSFAEAARKLADRTDVELPEPESEPGVSEQPKTTSAMIEAHELLKKFYHHLLKNTKEGEAALDYLLNRGFTKEIIDQFELGYSLDSWDFATKFLKKRGFSLELMEKAGLLAKRESDGAFFDRFRNRIMFPIWDGQGKTIGFSARLLGDSKREAKYMNSPETMIFNKSRTLYNFHHARPHMRKNQQAIVFEGFADVIAGVRSGLPHSVATMGTSLTEEQAKLIRRNAESVIICYDSDSAGIEAALRGSRILSAEGCYVKVAMMPDGMDPDDYIQKYGTDKFRTDVIGASVTLMSFKMQYLRRGRNLNDEGEKIRYVEDVLKEISQLDNAIERDHYLRQLADEFSFSLDALNQQLFEIGKHEKSKKDFSTRSKAVQPARKQVLAKKLLPAHHNAERHLIAHMLRSKDVSERVLNTIQGEFNIEEHRAIITYLYAFYEEGNEPDTSAFMNRLPDEKLHRIVSDIAMLSISEEMSEAELSDYIKQVLNYQKLLMIKEKEVEKNDAERQEDHLKAASIAMEILQMKKALK